MNKLEVYCKSLPSKYDTYTASRHIDILTFGRIPARGGFNNLTDFQKEIVEKVCENLAKFEYENKDTLNSTNTLASYSVGSVSMSFNNNADSTNFYSRGGVKIPMADYQMLKMTGLCSLMI